MKKSELKNELFSQLTTLLEPYEFALVRRMDWYVRKEESKLIYRLDFYDGYRKDVGYTVSPSLAIRIDRVEHIYHQVSGFEPKYQKDTPTIWPTINDLRKGDEGYEYLLDTHKDINPLSEKLFVIFREIALPFLEENSSIEAIDRLLNADPQNENNFFCIPQHRYFRGTIVAKLAKNDRYDQVVRVYWDELAHFLPEYLNNYGRLLKILEPM